MPQPGTLARPRLNVNTKQPNPVTGATWDDDFIPGLLTALIITTDST